MIGICIYALFLFVNLNLHLSSETLKFGNTHIVNDHNSNFLKISKFPPKIENLKKNQKFKKKSKFPKKLKFPKFSENFKKVIFPLITDRAKLISNMTRNFLITAI